MIDQSDALVVVEVLSPYSVRTDDGTVIIAGERALVDVPTARHWAASGAVRPLDPMPLETL